MIAVWRYLVFIICLAVLTLSDDDDVLDDDGFLNYIFELHNNARNKHRVQLLRRENNMDEVATSILNGSFNNTRANLARYGMISQSKENDGTLTVGEAKELFEEWYSQEENYNYCHEPNDPTTDEFSQIVWRDTQRIGLALEWRNDNYIVQVVYSPRGNIQGQFKANVLQPPIIAQALSNPQNLLFYERVSSQFLDYMFFLHNSARLKHRTEFLVRKNELDETATQILNDKSAGRNIRLDGNIGMNSLDRPYNNNTRLDAAEAEAIFSTWYNKKDRYHFRGDPSNHEADEFTQIVWENTDEFGIAMKKEAGFYRVVALYTPKGNIRGQYSRNVKNLRRR